MYSYPRGWTLNSRLLALCVSMVLVAILFSAYALTAHAKQTEEHKVDICHKGHVINVDENGWNGHSHHADDFQVITEEDRARCLAEESAPVGSIHVIKDIIGNSDASPSDFSFTINGGDAISFENDGQNDLILDTGTYSIAEVPAANYDVNYSAGCSNIELAEDGDATCTITNTYHTPDNTGDKTCTIVSSETTIEEGHVSSLLTYIHDAWKVSIPGASWIWGNNPAEADLAPGDPDAGSTETFTKTFTLTELPTGNATLVVGADNNFTVSLNGHSEGMDSSGNSFTLGSEKTFSLPVSDFQTGTNTLVFTVTNLPLWVGVIWHDNPAGLMYKLTFAGASCIEATDQCTNLDGFQTHVPEGYTADSNHVCTPASCTVVSDPTTFAGVVAATPTYVPDAPLWNPSPWTTIPGATWIWKSFLTDTSLIPDTTVFTKIITLNNAPSGATLNIAADNTYSVTVNGNPTTCDGSQIIPTNFNTVTTCPITLTAGANTIVFTVTNTEGSSDPHFNPAGLSYRIDIQGASCMDVPPATADLSLTKTVDDETPIVGQNILYTITVTNNGGASANNVKVDDVLPSGVTYSSDDGAGAYVGGVWTVGTVAAGESKVLHIHAIVTLEAAGEGDITNTASIEEDEQPVALDEIHPLVVSSHSASATIDVKDQGILTIHKVTHGGDGSFSFSLGNESITNPVVTTETGQGEVSGLLDAGSYDLTEIVPDGWTFNDVSCKYDDEETGVSIPNVPNGEHITVKAGETVTCTFNNTKKNDTPPTTTQCSDWLDNDHNGVTDKQDGACHTDGNPQNDASYDPTIDNESTPGTHHSGGGGGKVTHFTGQVLGASCGLYMDKHLRLGSGKNDVDQTKKLQDFLNRHFNAGLPVSGFFGKLTDGAVKKFQGQYGDQILKPWGIGAPTGLVYFTTLHQINAIECPDAAGDVPGSLIDWSKNKNAQ